MTTAREKAEAFAASCLYGADNSDAITYAARRLLAIVDQRFAELREKEKEGLCQSQKQCSTSSSQSSSESRSCRSSSQTSGPINTADDWVPTEEQIESLRKASPIHYSGDDERAVLGRAALRYTIREALIAGHRIAREDQCSNTSSAVSSPRVSFSSATTSTEAERTAVATKPDAPTESGTPSPKSGASSLDERAEAIFAANPGWRPRYGYQTLHLISGMDAWRWVDVPIGMSRGFVLQPDRNAHLLAALLPRAIEKWAKEARAPLAPNLSYVAREAPPRDLESAINILEGT